MTILKQTAIIAALLCSSLAWSAAAPYPLDDLSGDEISRAILVIKNSKQFTADVRFPIVLAKEPKKALVLAQTATSAPITREAFVLIYEPKLKKTWEGTVDLTHNQLALKELKGVQPPVLIEEYDRIAAIVRDDPRWQAAMKKRGITNLADVFIDGWAAGLMSPKERSSGLRLMRAVSYFKGNHDNSYARPIEGITVTVDMNNNKVVDVMDLGAVPIAKGAQEFSAAANAPLREAVKPLLISQPDGPSFTVHGQEISWQKWHFRYSMQPMKGLILYQVGYQDQGKIRSIMYKGGISDMLVPYGDPAKTWSFRNAFDVGEYGLGKTAHPLEAGKDVPPNAVFFDTSFSNDNGEVFVIPHSVAVYERDGGVLWKHNDQNTHINEIRRGRELVVTFTTTIGNYDYGVNWIFRQDATLETEVFLTGILLPKGTALTESPCTTECTHLVEPNIIAPPHQHFFCFRLDLDIDGAINNTPVEMNISALPVGPRNPDANAFDVLNTNLINSKVASRDLNPATHRSWKVINSSIKNQLGHPVGYEIMTGENSIPYLSKNSPIRKRASFVEHPMWFTQYHDEEQSAGSDYPNQSLPGNGLKQWAEKGESLQKQDVVMWYTFGITHIPRPEEWPVMPSLRAGFMLAPIHFFSRSPAMDVPPVSK